MHHPKQVYMILPLHFSRLLYSALFLISGLDAIAQSGGWLRSDYENTEAVSKALLQNSTAVSDTARARILNTKGIYHNVTGNNDSALYFFKKSGALLEHYPHLEAYPLLNLGMALNAKGESATALKTANKVLQLNRKLKKPLIEAISYQIMSGAYFTEDNQKKSVEYLLKGIKILEKNRLGRYVAEMKLNLANTYIQTNNYNFAADLFEDYISTATNRNSRMYAIALVNYSECLMELDRYDKAATLLQDNMPNVLATGDKELLAVVYSRLAKLEINRKRINEAIDLYDKAVDILLEKKSKYLTLILSEYLALLEGQRRYNDAIKVGSRYRTSSMYRKSTIHQRLEFEKAIANLYSKTGNLKESNKALTIALALCDSLRQTGNGELEHEIQARYQTEIQRQKNIHLKQNNSNLQKVIRAEDRLLLLYGIMALILIVLVFFLLRYYWLRNKLQKEGLRSVKAEAALLRKAKEHEADSARQKEVMVQEKQRELASMALKMATYYEDINAMIALIDAKELRTPQDLRKQLKKIAGEKDFWTYFELRFNKLHPDFKTKLTNTFEKLTKNDIEFCCLVKLGLSTKEIGSILNISNESVATKKYRLRKKLNISDEKDLGEILEGF